jgi:hypothetical protein
MDYEEFNRIIELERRVSPSPFLHAKILHRLEEETTAKIPAPSFGTLVLRPVLAVALLLLAVFTGFIAGKKSSTAGDSYNERLSSMKSEMYVSELNDEERTIQLLK